jgi:RNA polymerase sigma-70 factor (ECF subfamily)
MSNRRCGTSKSGLTARTGARAWYDVGLMSYIRGAAADESQFPTLLDIKAQFGFIPNFFRAQTLRPDLIDAEAGLAGTILLKDGALTRRQKEYIFLVCSANNLSTYCVTAHCEIVRMLGIQGPEPEQIALDHTSTDLPESDKALLDFAVRLNNHPRDIGREDIDGLRRYGFGDSHILESVVMVGLAKFANFIAFGLGTVPDFDPSRIIEELQLPRPGGPEKEMNPSAGVVPLMDEDSELVSRTRSGDLEAFDELVRRHGKRIYRTLIAITRHADEAEDGVQNVFMKAFQHIGTFQGASKFVTWLTRIAINEGTERLRARRDMETLDEQEMESEAPFRPRDAAAWLENPEQLYSKKELRERVEAELLKLPAKYRVVLMLRDIQQFSTEETAEILKIGVPALKSRLLRGRLMLREALAPAMARRAANV